MLQQRLSDAQAYTAGSTGDDDYLFFVRISVQEDRLLRFVPYHHLRTVLYL